MNRSRRVLAVASLAVIAGVVIAWPGPAVADSASDWIKPASEGANSLTDSLVTIGAPILGLGIAGYGVWSAITNNLDFRRLVMFLMGGALIGVGKPFATWFMGLFGS